MNKLFLALWLSFAMALPLVGCADEVNAKTDDITTDNDDDGTAGNPGDGDTDVDVDTDNDTADCEASCDDDECVAACRGE